MHLILTYDLDIHNMVKYYFSVKKCFILLLQNT